MVGHLQTILNRVCGLLPGSRARGGPDFSIIIPVRAAGPRLRRSLDSLLHQPGVTIEVLVAEYGICEESRAAIADFPGKLTYLAMAESGVYEAMNAAIFRAGGRIFYFMGAGDRLRPGILPEILSAYDWSASLLVYGDVFMEDVKEVYDGPFDAEKLRRKNICHQAMFYSHRLVRRLGPYETRYRLLADYVWNMRAFADPKTSRHYHQAVIADYEGAGLSAQGQDEVFLAERAALNRRYLPLQPKRKL